MIRHRNPKPLHDSPANSGDKKRREIPAPGVHVLALVFLMSPAAAWARHPAANTILPHDEPTRVAIGSGDSRFRDNGDGTLTDTDTGLMWTQKDSYAVLKRCLTWTKAREYVSNLNTGGHRDWRMPTPDELKAIYGSGKNKTFKGEDVNISTSFARNGTWYFWTSEESGDSAVGVDFMFGYNLTEKKSNCGDGGVLAVRDGGGGRAPAPIPSSGGGKKSDGRFANNGDGTVTDSNTGLMWAHKDSYAELGKCLNWADSKKYVAGLRTGGYSDWRLPTMAELKGILNTGKVLAHDSDAASPLRLSDVFAPGGAYGYWSSETPKFNTARNLEFHDGDEVEFERTGCMGYGVRAVRSGGGSPGVSGSGPKSDGRFTDNGDGSVTDTRTGLMWSKDDTQNIFNACQGLAWL
ncbi:MAG: hypothetical protein GMKNLPBB_03014 [Myxococcota bacterium]|nr:hypothetical protein [Myxococcota bacterium]